MAAETTTSRPALEESVSRTLPLKRDVSIKEFRELLFVISSTVIRTRLSVIKVQPDSTEEIPNTSRTPIQVVLVECSVLIPNIEVESSG